MLTTPDSLTNTIAHLQAIALTGLRVDGGEQVVAIRTSRPTLEVPHVLWLLKLRIERIDPGMGLEQFLLVTPHTEPLDAVDLGAVLVGETLQRDPGRLVDVVAGRIGARSVFRIAPVPSHDPERTVTQADPVDAPGGDHYRVEDGEGGRWWVFRRGERLEEGIGDLSWWMHGMCP
ncbi:hypothetical protein [Sphingomonas mollis]|uniref:hypothetical protein n=1 Tax=Sphingomonas mollis TaxID=2795726 RepID=UPI001E58409F|nr:hypothetical protein [Sphingomonas sp. BT553]